MCGIFGVIYRDPRRRADQARVIAARDTLTHRGPDEAGLWLRDGAALAHRRLRVLDLTHGQQPMVSPGDRHALVYNGEVYNFLDLRPRYESRGIRFDTRCDTELVFHALNADGPDAIKRFNGMFAIGHWDNVDHRLLLARDPLGKKPIYWTADAQRVVFASELKAILEFLGEKFPVDAAALDQFFARGYTLAPRTVFQGIHKLPAGCRLLMDAHPDRWSWRVEPYWDFTPVEVPDDEGSLLDELESLLADAVKIRLVSDVPIGCLLSGGVDSSLVTALAAKQTREPIKAFSIGFSDAPDHDETAYAKLVAEHHGCDWWTRSVESTDFMAMLDDAAGWLDEPFGNFTVFAMRRLARLARERLVVVLTGQGGDELGGGYAGRYQWVAQTEPAACNRMTASVFSPAIDDLLHHLHATSFVRWTGGREAIFSAELCDAIDAGDSPREYVAPFWNRHRPRNGTSGGRGMDRLNNVLYTDVRTNLADYLIHLEERASMSASLEARNPMLDPRVVNFMLSVPSKFKLRDGSCKWLVTQLARRHVPAAAIDRPKKGFTPPLGLWFARNADGIREIFRQTDADTAALYSHAWRQRLQSGRFEAGLVMPAFYSLMLATWVQRYGKYISTWPASSRSSNSPAQPSAPVTSSRHQAALRYQDPTTVAEARWFCQMLANAPEGGRVCIEGDGEGWFAYLAGGSGFRVVSDVVEDIQDAGTESDEQLDAIVLIGEPALRRYRNDADWRSMLGAKQVLMFVPFIAREAAATQSLLGEMPAVLELKGYQAVKLNMERAALIARGTPLNVRAAVA